MPIDRRTLTWGAAAALAMPRSAHAARSATNSAGRKVELPDRIARVFAAGGPAAVAVYVLRPDAMVGWPRAVRDEEKPYVLPGVRDLPGVGMITGRGDTANVELMLKTKPDLIVDFGSTRQTFVSLADSVQSRTGIPYVLIDGRFEATAESLRLLGAILGVPERGAALAQYTEDLFSRVDAAIASVPSRSARVSTSRGDQTVWRPGSRARSTPRSSNGPAAAMSPTAATSSAASPTFRPNRSCCGTRTSSSPGTGTSSIA